ncbi:beta-1,2-xylosyltransferase XYXT1-like isoform X1 [Hordeum vulgare subsp. vulgare]|uniref:Glycosyltransferase 61 catalytic domain-containing protein n=1 Tax=Hordeum vulgare subsp. vulgare TaxID=112509 RepID=A0A8I6XYS3_HORVV|nr:beta-1,2-xylosyltransferase XYXT1-like isoform X1 [Hordeum vulgare subsp. vulgare]
MNMSCSEERERPRRSWAPVVHVNFGFVAGVVFVLLVYFVVQQQEAISALGVATTTVVSQWMSHKQLIKAPREIQPIKAPGEILVASDVHAIAGKQPTQDTVLASDVQPIVDKQPIHDSENGEVVCHTEGLSRGYSETCEVDGDVRTNGTALSVTLVPASRSVRREWMIMPYAKMEVVVRNVTVTQLQDRAAAPPCTVTHTMPAVLFAIGGYVGNYWHDYTDILVPLFVASRRYRGEVTFLISNIQHKPEWLVKYKTLLGALSKHAWVDMDGDTEVRCFPHVTVGLRLDKELSIVPELVPGAPLSMVDFTRFLRETYGLPRGAAVSLTREPDKKPRLLLIHRGHYRLFLNELEIAQAAEAAGFEAVVMELRGNASEVEQARLVNSFDVLLGMHGAGLTNALHLPPGGVLIQVVPYGNIEVIARSEFSEGATDMGLKYLDYSVSAEESSLMELLGPEHPAIKDPDSIHRSGWTNMFDLYLGKQNVRINTTRFAPTLAQALGHLRQQ